MKKLIKIFCFLCVIIFVSSTHAAVISIDLNDFYADPTVTVAADGSSALIEEDPGFSSVLLSNDPLLGDPGITIPSGLLNLSFDYMFSEPVSNDDEFYAWVFDGVTGNLFNEYSVNASSTGNVSWDLSGLDPSVSILGLEFQLNAFSSDSSFDSYVQISSVQLETASVPVPSSLVLLGSGLAGLFGMRRKRS